MPSIYTIGHSTRTFDELIEALRAHQIALLVDIRSFPASRRLPHFNRESLEATLPASGIDYRWMRDLGGRRTRQRDDSPNTALRDSSFRNYADYMLTPQFQAAADELVKLAADGARRVALMCAERVWFRCHRMLVSDWLVAHGHRILHIDGIGPLREHKMLAEAQMRGGDVIYGGLF